MELGRASLGSKSTALVVQQNLPRFVHAAAEGDRFVEAKSKVEKDSEKARLMEENIETFTLKLEQFLDGRVMASRTPRMVFI